MTVTITISYPRTSPPTPFDLDYYLSTHMPLVQEGWASKGLKSWSVITMDDASPYTVQALLQWESEEAFNAAAGSEQGKGVFADIKNFTPGSPVKSVGKIVGSSS